jgi:hypothetical protein
MTIAMQQNDLITMTKNEASRYDTIKKLIDKKIDGTEAAKALHLSVRQIKRIKAAVVVSGIKGVIHGNRGHDSNRKIDETVIKKAKELLIAEYHDFNPLLAQEKLFEIHNIILSKETVRKLMIKEKLWKPKRKGEKKKYAWRERKDNYGDMDQFDGSYHNWFEGRNEIEVGLEQCLLLAVDDATGKITGAEFDYNEGIRPVFGFWKRYFKDHGFPLAIYMDKFSTYKVNHKNAVDNKELMTQFERAMNQLNIQVIHANSPQAKGRVEKMNGTLQRRLIKEMRLAKINTIVEANKFLKEVFIPKFNKQFAVVSKKPADLHRKLNDKQLKELDGILSVWSERVVNNDYTIRFKGEYFQLNEIQPTTIYKKSEVTIEEYLDGGLKIRAKGHYLNYFKLPERPRKEIDIKLPALTIKTPTAHRPPADHPWRNYLLINKKQLTSTAA